MGAESADVAATIAEATQVPDGKELEPKQGAESAPAVTNPDENPDEVLNPVQKRIDELTQKRRDAEREKDYWRQQAFNAQRPAEPAAPKVEEPRPAGKKLADFGYDEEKYQDYLFEQVEARALKTVEKTFSQKQEESSRIHNITAHKAREAKFAKDVPDYFEIAHYAPITDSMAQMVMKSDRSAELAYHLGKNPEVAAKISQLPEREQAWELGRLEAKLTDKPKPPVISNAPPPAPRIDGASNSGPTPKVDTPESDKLSDLEWSRLRNKQVSKQRGR